MLFLVPTPIGNLEDITLRAVRVLSEADIVACEDTRVTGKLLKHLEIDARMVSFHAHNERGKVDHLVLRMHQGTTVALVSDAGSPGISDPGFLLVRRCVEEGIAVSALPGPTAIIPALTASGLPCDRFVFEGFLPAKKGRRKRLETLKQMDRTIVLFESPHRIKKTLAQLVEALGADRPCVIAREVSKKFEEYIRGSLDSVADVLDTRESVKGEIVIIVGADPHPAKTRTESDR